MDAIGMAHLRLRRVRDGDRSVEIPRPSSPSGRRAVTDTDRRVVFVALVIGGPILFLRLWELWLGPVTYGWRRPAGWQKPSLKSPLFPP